MGNEVECQIMVKSWTCTLCPKFKMIDNTAKPESLIFCSQFCLVFSELKHIMSL